MTYVPSSLIDDYPPLPSNFVRRAAIFVAGLLDKQGNESEALAHAFRAAATDGLYTFDNLRDGLGLLVASGLAVVDNGIVRPSPALTTMNPSSNGPQALIERLTEPDFAAYEVEDARTLRAVVGDVGERHVADLSRKELIAQGRADLAEQVLQVSRISDRFGFDVSTPTLSGENRALEVKATLQQSSSACRFFLTRNEYEVGRRMFDTWLLVFCRVEIDRSQLPSYLKSPLNLEAASTNARVKVIGHCPAATLALWVPEDRNGRWMECMVTLPSHLLVPGLPSLRAEKAGPR